MNFQNNAKLYLDSDAKTTIHFGPAVVGEQRRRVTIFPTILTGTLLSATAAFALPPYDAVEDSNGGRKAGAPLEALPISPTLPLSALPWRWRERASR